MTDRLTIINRPDNCESLASHRTRKLLKDSLKVLSPYVRCPNCGNPAQARNLGEGRYSTPCCYSIRHPGFERSADQIVLAASVKEGLNLAAELPEPEELTADKAKRKATADAIEQDRLNKSTTESAKGFGRFLNGLLD